MKNLPNSPQLPLTLGAKTSAASTSVVIASDQTAVPVSGTVTTSDPTHSFSDSVRNDYSSVNVTTGAWVQLIASTAAIIRQLHVFDSSGQTLELGTGAAAAETRVLIVPPGGFSSIVYLNIAAATRLSIRAISGTANAGEIDVTGIS